MLGCVYITINKTNGRAYVGQTHYPLRKRYIGSGRVFKLAIKKYGRYNFDFNVVGSFDNQEEIDQLEIDLIAILRSYGCSLYNVAPGGFRGGSGHLTTEQKKKVSDAKLGIKRSAEQRANMALAQSRIPIELKRENWRKMRIVMAQKGIPPSRKGKKNSPEHIAKVSLAQTGRKLSPEAMERRLKANAERRANGTHHRKPYKKYKGRPWTEETRIKQRLVQTGRKKTEEELKRRLERNELMRSLGLHKRKRKAHANSTSAEALPTS